MGDPPSPLFGNFALILPKLLARFWKNFRALAEREEGGGRWEDTGEVGVNVRHKYKTKIRQTWLSEVSIGREGDGMLGK